MLISLVDCVLVGGPAVSLGVCLYLLRCPNILLIETSQFSLCFRFPALLLSFSVFLSFSLSVYYVALSDFCCSFFSSTSVAELFCIEYVYHVVVGFLRGQ